MTLIPLAKSLAARLMMRQRPRSKGACAAGAGDKAVGMMAAADHTLLIQVLIHAGYLLTAGAFLLRDILWLRLLAIAANLAMATAAYLTLPVPRWEVIAWAGVFITINLGHSLWLLYERHFMRFTEEERRLCDTAFKALDHVLVRRMLRRSAWKSVPEGQPLMRHGERPTEILLIASGEAAVQLGDRTISHLKAGAFVGEMSFLKDEVASATVVATKALRCAAWRQGELAALFKRRPELRHVFHAAVGRDLAQKIAEHNLKLSTL